MFVKIYRWWDDLAQQVRQNKAFLGMVANHRAFVLFIHKFLLQGF